MITIPVIYAIYLFVKPSFEAFSLLLVEPASLGLFEASKPELVDPKNVLPYLQTQIGLITSDRVLAPASAAPKSPN